MLSKVLLTALVCGLITAGCAGSDDAPEAAPSPTPVTSADPESGPISGASAVPVAKAGGVLSAGSLPRKAEGLDRSLMAVADDGALIMHVSKPDTRPVSDGVRYAEGRLEVVRPGAEAVRIPGAAREVDNVVADRRHVVWAENVPAAGERARVGHGQGPFRIMAYDRQTRAVRTLALLPASSRRTAPAVSVAGDRAYWTVTRIPTGATQVFSRALSGRGLVVRHLNTPGVVDVGPDGLVFGVTGTGKRAREFRILQLDPNTGATHVVHKGKLAAGETLDGVVAYGGAIAWTTAEQSGGDIVTRAVLRESDGKVVRFAPDLAAADPDLTSRFLSFEGGAEDGEAWLYDRSRGELVALGAAPGREAVMGAGEHVAWADGDVWRYAEVADVDSAKPE